MAGKVRVGLAEGNGSLPFHRLQAQVNQSKHVYIAPYVTNESEAQAAYSFSHSACNRVCNSVPLHLDF